MYSDSWNLCVCHVMQVSENENACVAFSMLHRPWQHNVWIWISCDTVNSGLIFFFCFNFKLFSNMFAHTRLDWVFSGEGAHFPETSTTMSVPTELAILI